MDLGLQDRVVLVTGGSSGIGRALAEAYGREGARVALTYHSDHGGARAAAGAVEEAGGEALIVPFELADPDTAQAAVAAAVDRWGRLDVLVASAIAWPDRSPGGRLEDLPVEAVRSGLRTNLEGTIALTQAALAPMRRAGWGRILFMSTGLAEEGMPGAEVYTSTKAALHGLARSLAWSAGGDGVLVNVLALGLTLTDRNHAMVPVEVRRQLARQMPLRELSRPHQVTPPALFLTSAANTTITGEIVHEGSSTGRSSHAA